MLSLTFADLHHWLAIILWPLFRLTAFMLTAPVLGHSSIPVTVKIGLGVLVTILIAPILPPMPDIAIWSWSGFAIIVEQILIGASLGMVLAVMFAAITAAGDFVGLQMGLGFATFVSPDAGADTALLSRLFYVFCLLMFLAFNIHLLAIQTLVFSFQVLPIGLSALDIDGFNLLVRFGSTIFINGLILALPLMASVQIVNLTLGILNRSSPQMTVFSVGFPTSLTLGLFMLGVMVSNLGYYLNHLFGEGLDTMMLLLQQLAPL